MNAAAPVNVHLVVNSPRGAPINSQLLFAIVLFMACTSSGGIILGTGAFAEQAIATNLLSSADIDTVANFAFQMLTWLSLVWSCLHDSLGPRGCAVAGSIMAASGHLIIAIACANGTESAYVYAFGLGLVGGGGNGAYIASFHFTTLFQKTRGVRTALLASSFNVAAYPLLLLGLPRVTLSGFFFAYAAYAGVLAVVAAALFPDRAYVEGDQPLMLASYGGSGEQRASLMRRTWGDLCMASADLRTRRFWGFVLTFAWGALTQQWAGSAVGSGLLFSGGPPWYLSYAPPHPTSLDYTWPTPPRGTSRTLYVPWPTILTQTALWCHASGTRCH